MATNPGNTSAQDIIGQDTAFANDIKRIAPNGLPSWEAQFIEDEMQAGMESNALGLLAGFQFPANLGMADFSALTSIMEQYGAAVGYRNLPTPQEFMQAYNSGVKDLSSAAKLWGAKLPKSLGYVKHGMTAQQFEQYKETNKQAIISRYGAHADAKQENFVENLDNPMPQFSSQAQGMSQQPVAGGASSPGTATIGHTQSAVR